MHRSLVGALILSAAAALAPGEDTSLPPDVFESAQALTLDVPRGDDVRPPDVPLIRPWEVPLALAFEEDVLPRGLAVRADIVRLAPESWASRAVAVIEVPLGDLQARVDPSTGHWSTHLSIVAYVKDDDGQVLARLGQDGPLEGPGPLSVLRGRSVMFKRTLDLRPGRYILEAAAQDRLSGRLGARRVPFLIPEVSSGPAIGSVAVVRFQPAPLDGQELDDPLLIRERRWQKATVRALPVLETPLAAETGRIGVLAALRPGRDGGPISVTVEFRRDGEVLAQACPEIPDPDPTGQILLARSFELPSTEPGWYQVYVRVRQREKVTSAGTSFQLERANPSGLPPAS